MFESLYQSFTDQADRAQSAARFKALREELARQGLDGFIVPRADRHQNEYVPPSDERLAWLTGFTGSAGLAIVLKDRAVLFVDARYTIQARDQVDLAVVEPVPLATTSPEKWLEANLPAGAKLGYDPWLHTPGQIERYEKAAANAEATLVAVDLNPIDAIWTDRPPPPQGAVKRHPPRLAGESAKKKLARIIKALGKADALVVSDPHAVAWAFNIRGADVSHTPLPLAFALIPREGKPRLYIEAAKLNAATRAYLEDYAKVEEPAGLEDDLKRLGQKHRRVLFDTATVPVKLTRLLKEAGGTPEIGQDPTALMKARKNEAELEGSRAAHLRDGAAIVRFLHWFDTEAPKGKLTEIDAARALETFRRETGKLKDLSFPTISAAGPHSAIPHYRVTEASNRKISRGIYLVDSGGQYEDGTTDITRTLAVGAPTQEMRDRFTRVLKGHIAIARALFPKGTSGGQIDALARLALWQAGVDFDHGTGHGVGSYLSVHEGPQRISKIGGVALEPGMILSNEPGYYKADHFGIRIENLIVVTPRKIKGAERETLGFETITFAPIDLTLVEPKLLDPEEIAWLDAYHAEVRKRLSPYLDRGDRQWLAQATQPLGGANAKTRHKARHKVKHGRR
ncbi:X-Pro aminopeptidase [Methylovirgula ligni]|uniref:Xaa-Pro aminopeptidase n=1 Tax=Methylovirgula ligni TaxID=569860 RepID=A0A3D9Z4J5_9HYPH|nr:aminopeptidase P family protein [Methylovirgula ligni]QAY96228.1 X-Pro aminopeptidase [Methylovirgula ligni]REF86069.1 Xaa-Pro aminopeptidase [Methylovirgula ligni]